MMEKAPENLESASEENISSVQKKPWHWEEGGKETTGCYGLRE